MPNPAPPPLSATALRARRNRVARLAARLGFVGRVEYRHVYSRTGGASYGQAATADRDLLTVYAEAFERDADPNEFSLNAILAHERGHQLLLRHPRLAGRAPTMPLVGPVGGAVLRERHEPVQGVHGVVYCIDNPLLVPVEVWG